MTNHTHTANLTAAHPRSASVVERLRALFRAVFNRRETTRLLDLDDRQLADIGIERQDVRKALHAPFWQDPSTELSRVQRARRRQG